MKKKIITLILLSLFIIPWTFAIGEEALTGVKGQIYVDETCGFKITGPKGWFKEIVPPQPGKTSRESVMYRKHKIEEGVFPRLAITSDTPFEDITTALDFAKSTLQYWKEALIRNQSGALQVIEEPHELEINGIRAARFIYGMADIDGKSMLIVEYKFMKGNVGISVIGMDWASSFDIQLKDFEEAANSFKFFL